MPPVSVVFYREEDGSTPVLEWLDKLSAKVRTKCRVRIERLKQLGHELRRPEADYLRDGIYELRIGLRGINYRILYFFHGTTVAVLGTGLIKERAVPATDIDTAVKRKQRFERNPVLHTFTEV
ncbi:MAG: type II toxin-antitoxin system RelE/ParE family toxin [Pirellulales bacterium]